MMNGMCSDRPCVADATRIRVIQTNRGLKHHGYSHNVADATKKVLNGF